nr:MAG TPA: protein of unknown function (DUF5433) [Caudoviricetes sp.]
MLFIIFNCKGTNFILNIQIYSLLFLKCYGLRLECI